MNELEVLKNRMTTLESLLTRQERMMDELSAEILRLNTLFERLERRFEAYAVRQETAQSIRLLSEEPPPPHY